MEHVFGFIGSYWWLAFPFFGIMASIGGAWERRSRQRHKQRLEMMHAKAELKAAEAAAKGRIPLAAAGYAPVAEAEPDSQATQLDRLFTEHDAVTARWLDYELDVAKLIAFPAMSDGRQPLTAAFLRAKRVADGLRPASAKARLTPAQLAEYRSAVTDYEVAFDLAERDARRLKDSSFTEVERKRLGTAKQLLTVAIDQAATPAERQLAYRRVREELDGLISLSDEAIVVLEEKVALELTTGASATVPAAERTTDAAASPAPEPPPVRDAAAQWPVPSRVPRPAEPPTAG